MIFGAHLLFYSKDPEADRAFFRDILKLTSMDVGGGWLIFKLPPAEAAFHPVDGEFEQVHADQHLMGAVLYLMCDDLRSTVESLQARNVPCTAIDEADWGIKTTFRLPSGGEIGLYQPKHPTALELV